MNFHLYVTYGTSRILSLRKVIEMLFVLIGVQIGLKAFAVAVRMPSSTFRKLDVAVWTRL